MPQLEDVHAAIACEEDPLSRSDPGSGILSAVLSVYREQGYERGYERALGDLLSSLVPLTEQYLRAQHLQTPDARRLVYGYIEFLESHIHRASSEAGYVTGGLGI